jgi:hypothetical protein
VIPGKRQSEEIQILKIENSMRLSKRMSICLSFTQNMRFVTRFLFSKVTKCNI